MGRIAGALSGLLARKWGWEGIRVWCQSLGRVRRMSRREIAWRRVLASEQVRGASTLWVRVVTCEVPGPKKNKEDVHERGAPWHVVLGPGQGEQGIHAQQKVYL